MLLERKRSLVLLIPPPYRGGGVATPTRGALPFALAALAAKQTDSRATKLHRTFAERRAKHVAP